MNNYNHQNSENNTENDVFKSDNSYRGNEFFQLPADMNEESVPTEPYTKKELRVIALNATLAALAVAAVFIIGAALFILFCIHVWFK